MSEVKIHEHYAIEIGDTIIEVSKDDLKKLRDIINDMLGDNITVLNWPTGVCNPNPITHPNITDVYKKTITEGDPIWEWQPTTWSSGTIKLYETNSSSSEG